MLSYVFKFRSVPSLLLQFRSVSFHGSLWHSSIQMSFKVHELPSTEKAGIPVIIMHGLFGAKNNWNSISKALLPRLKRKIINVDARNHGDSTHTDEFSYPLLVADLNRLFRDHQMSKGSLIGHSMGGRAMMLFAQHYPENVEKLIVVDISPFPSSKSIHGMKLYFDVLKSIKLSRDLPISAARKLADDHLSQSISDPEIRQFLLTNLVKEESGNFGWKMNLDSLSTNFIEHIVQFPVNYDLICRKPTLFIGGTKSDYLRPSDESNIRKLFPEAKFVYLDCGHWVHAEKPHEFIALASDFLSNT